MLSRILLVLTLSGCGSKTSHPVIELVSAQRLSDSFMSDLIAHRTDAALDKMESKFQKMTNRSEFAPQLEKLFQYCGWPLDSELKDVGIGTQVYSEGNTNPIRKFTYAV